jgi:hypothetical protein
VFRAQTDWIFILPSELPTKELHHLPRKMPPQAYQTSQYVVPCGGIFLGKWPSTFAGSSDGKMNVQSTCALNILYNIYWQRNEHQRASKQKKKKRKQINVCYMPRPAYSCWFDHSNNIRRRVKIVEVLTLQFFLASCHFPPSHPFTATPSQGP